MYKSYKEHNEKCLKKCSINKMLCYCNKFGRLRFCSVPKQKLQIAGAPNGLSTCVQHVESRLCAKSIDSGFEKALKLK